MRVALVTDSMSAYGGAERVIEQILQLYPQADVFAVVDALPPHERGFLGGRPLKTSFLQSLPGIKRIYRSLLALWPMAVEQFDVTDYDLVISSHHSVAYGVLTHPGQVHVAYVHSPMRYAWDLQHEYLREAKLTRGVKSWIARRMLHSARIWDFCAAQRPDVLVANSEFVASRLRRIHRREAQVVHPPVAVGAFTPSVPSTGIGAGPKRFYLSVGRVVPYKRQELLVRAFARMPGRSLKIVGVGPDLAKLHAMRAPNVELLGGLSTPEVRHLMAEANALVFAGIEDFGITAVEVQAAGTPVIAYGRGGLTETVAGLDAVQPTGVLFDEQTEDAVIDAVERFEAAEIRQRITQENCVANAARFSEDRFRRDFGRIVSAAMAGRHQANRPAVIPLLGGSPEPAG